MSDWYTANQIARVRYEGLSEHAAEQHRRRMRARGNGRRLFARIRSIPGAAVSALDIPSLSTRPAEAVKAFWWVPAGFAVFILLQSIIGG